MQGQSSLKPETHLSEKFQNQKGKMRLVKFQKESIAKFVASIPMGERADGNYRQVFDNRQSTSSPSINERFIDHQFIVNGEIDFQKETNSEKRKIIVKRLSTMYGSIVPAFFPKGSKPNRVSGQQEVPHCIQELAIFDMFNYQHLFLTDGSQTYGKYDLYLNNEGRFEVITVDDRIPVYEDTLEPIWGLNFQNPWELILIKAYAKKQGGYSKLWSTNPFNFIESVSNPTWKYYNLQREADQFLRKIQSKSVRESALIILKTKNSSQVSAGGLLKNSAAFKLKNLQKIKINNIDEYIITISTTKRVNWVGQMNYADTSNINYIKSSTLNIDTQFVLNQKDAVNFFSSIYLTSNRNQKFYTGHEMIDISANHKKAIHFAFQIPKIIQKQGNNNQTDLRDIFDVSIRQASQNTTQALSKKSRIGVQSTTGAQNLRYLRTKIIIVKDTLNSSSIHVMNTSNIGQSKITQSKIEGQKNKREKFPKIRYQSKQIEYRRGYNRGDAIFMKLEPGKYILRLKSQHVDHKTSYAINWVSSFNIRMNMKPLLSDIDKIKILEDAFSSKCWQVPHGYIDAKQRFEMNCEYNSFDIYGYGFLGCSLSEESVKKVKIEIDPKKLQEEGYKLKGSYKDIKTLKTINLERSDYRTIVLKLIKNENSKCVWPPTGIVISKKKDSTQSNEIIDPAVNQEKKNEVTNNP